MKEPKQKNDILKDYLSDMYAVEKHCLESVERQTRDYRVRASRDAYEILMKVETVLSAHTMTLDRCLSEMEGAVDGKSFLKKAASTAVGAVSGIYGMMRPEDPVSRSLRDDHTTLNLAAISYSMLYTTATALGDVKIADMALRHLHEITPLIVAIGKIIPPVVAEELSSEGKVAYPMAGRDAVEKTQQAWNCENIQSIQ